MMAPAEEGEERVLRALGTEEDKSLTTFETGYNWTRAAKWFTVAEIQINESPWSPKLYGIHLMEKKKNPSSLSRFFASLFRANTAFTSSDLFTITERQVNFVLKFQHLSYASNWIGLLQMLCHIERNFFVFDLSSKCFMYLIVIIILIRMLKFMLNLYWKIIFTPFLRLSLTLFWLGGGEICAPPPSRFF